MRALPASLSTCQTVFCASATFLLLSSLGATSSSSNSTADGRPARDALSKGRLLIPPVPRASVDGEYESSEFWSANSALIREAWSILDETEGSNLVIEAEHDGRSSKVLQLAAASPDMIDRQLANAISSAWSSPSLETEGAVKSLLVEAAPGVYKCKLLAPEGIARIRAYLDMAASSGIPTRRPNGMNRYGVIVDDDIDGAVSLPGLTSLCKFLVSEYIRPMGRMLFPSTVGADDDVESFAFTIRYSDGEDRELNEHSDASVVTMNVNLNLPTEGYDGSKVYFVNPEDKREHEVEFEPGVALFHRGSVRHAASPISEGGTRQNLVIWLFGRDGYVRVAPYDETEQLTVEERWTRCSDVKSESIADEFHAEL